MNGYEPVLTETDGGLLCRDCMAFCFFGTRLLTGCDVENCCCVPCAEARRAIEADDRPADKLAVIANELERERTGNLRDLTAERFGRPTERHA